MEVGALLFSFFIIFASAKILGELSVRLGLPVIVGELVAGAFLGSHVLGLIDSSHPVLMSFAEIGVMFLIFHVGLEVSVKELFGVGRTAVLVGAYLIGPSGSGQSP